MKSFEADKILSKNKIRKKFKQFTEIAKRKKSNREMSKEQEKFDQAFADLQKQRMENNNIIDNAMDQFKNLKLTDSVNTKENKKVFSTNEVHEMQKQNDFVL